MVEADEAVLAPMSEEELARWKSGSGTRIVRSHGRLWEVRPRGFYHALHWMARLPREDAVRPARLCWGFRTTLSAADSDFANAATPVHLLSDLDHYDLSALAPRQRSKIRRCRERVRIVAFRTLGPLRDQGLGVLESKLRRIPYRSAPSLPSFLRNLDSCLHTPGVLILGGLLQERLLGYLIAFAVGETAYIDSVDIHSDALPTNVGSALIFEAAQAARRSGVIRELVHGLEMRENPELALYKHHMGFSVTPVASRVWISPAVEWYVRRHRSQLYYRLTGRSA